MSASAFATREDTTEPRSWLRLALILDAVITGVNGAAYLVAAGPLGELFGLPVEILRGAGAFLLLFGLGVWATARQDTPVPGAVSTIVAVNVLWAAASLVLALSGWASPTTVGTVWIVMQAIVVGGFAELQVAGRRRMRR